MTTEINQKIESIIGQAPLVLFMKGNPQMPMCRFSAQVVQILNSVGVEFSSFDILNDEIVRQELKVYSNWPTFPQLYFKGKLVGGCDIITEMVETGDLQEMLQ